MDLQPIKNEMIERVVLASSIISDSCLEDLAIRLTPDAFCNVRHKAIALELIRVSSKGVSPDLTLLTNRLGEDYYPLLTELVMNCATTNDIVHHCEKLKNIENARNVVNRAIEVVSRANSATDYSEFTPWAIEHVKGFYEGSGGVSELDHISNYILDATKEFKDVVDGRLQGLKTGIADIDRTSGGFRGGEYVVIAGRPSQGKSSLGLSIIKNMAMQGKRVGLFSLEMTAVQNVFKLTSMMSASNAGVRDLPYSVFRGQSVATSKNFESFGKCCTALQETSIYINTSSYSTINDIENELRRFCKRNELDAFVVDYIGLVGDENSNANKKNHEKVADISHKFRSIIKELSVVGIVLVQLNRDSHNKKPNMANLADSTQIERDAHFVYLIHQPDLEDKTKKVIICDKARDGGEGEYPTHFCTQTTEFVSMELTEGENYMDSLRNGGNTGGGNENGLAF